MIQRLLLRGRGRSVIYNIPARILLKTSINDIPLKLFGSNIEPFLKIGHKIFSAQFFGNQLNSEYRIE